MTVFSSITKISNLLTELHPYFKQKFKTSPYEIEKLNDEISHYLSAIKEDLWVYIEYPYTDKVFRDSYYNYFSSKSTDYHRHCIRIALFDSEILENDFRKNIENGNEDDLQKKYLGFFVIRPLYRPIGRNVISPNALKDNNFSCSVTKFSTLINGRKLDIVGFPHLSQDTETHSCAESTIWATMEYFSHRYPEYRPVLPSEIIETLKNISYERQIPSSGLSLDFISYAIKEYGFGSKLYSLDEYPEHELNGLLSTYIESGIPIIVGITSKSGSIGHAIVAIGRENINQNKVNNILPTSIKDSFEVLDFNYTDKDIVFIDDNYRAYQKADPKSPAEHYPTEDWKSCKISCFVVPLHKKVYLEAFGAKIAIYSLIRNYHLTFNISNKSLVRYFLTSSRSYKSIISTNQTYSEELKEIIINIALPRFIWVCELSDKSSFNNDECNGLILIDATEPNTLNTKPLILFVYENKFINFAAKFEGDDGLYLDFLNEVVRFSPYKNNLKEYN